jgi:hypothetical protein
VNADGPAGSRLRGGAFILLLVVVGGCAPEAEVVPWQVSFGYSTESVHPIEIGEFGYPYLPVGIGADTVRLPFDTGNMVGLTIHEEIFDRLDLPCSETYGRRDSAGRPVSTGCIAHGIPTNVFGTESDSRPVYEFTHEALPGLVGPLEVPGTRFTIDYRRGLLAIDDRRSPVTADGFEAVRLVPSPSHPRLVLVRGRVEGREVLIEIDTGKSRTTVDRDLVEALQLEETPAGVAIDRVELGPRSWSVPAARVVDTSGVSASLPAKISLGVGSDVLARFVITVDYAAGLLWIEG